MKKEHINNSKYIQGDSRVRTGIFIFLGLWIALGLFLRTTALTKMEQINKTTHDTRIAIHEMNHVFLFYVLIPLSIFLSIQGVYFLRIWLKTIRAKIYPPPGIGMPFRTKIQTGRKAILISLAYLFSGICSFTVIVILLMIWRILFKRI